MLHKLELLHKIAVIFTAWAPAALIVAITMQNAINIALSS